MIPLDEAIAHVLERCEPLNPVRLALSDTLGCALAEPVHALENVPPFANTAVDGYAVRAGDTTGATPEAPVELDVVGELAAGAAPREAVGPGQAIRIMTGAPLPPGADAVVMVEDTEPAGGGARVRVSRAAHHGDAVRSVGDDVLAGQLLFPMLTELRPAHLGVLASVGYSTVPVFPRARVGVLSTGDELVEDGRPLRPGQIRESNRTMLLGLVERAGAQPVDLGLVRDERQAMTAAIRRAVQVCDAVVTSGGVSMGDYDLVKVVLDEMGDMRWMQIAIRPAKPFAFGLLRGEHGRAVPVLGLPGNPVSSLVSFELLARPALRRMMGHAELHRPTLRALADEPLRRRPDGKVHFVRTHGWFAPDGRWHVRSTGAQGSHQLAATAAANGLAVLPDGVGVGEGADVDVVLLL